MASTWKDPPCTDNGDIKLEVRFIGHNPLMEGEKLLEVLVTEHDGTIYSSEDLPRRREIDGSKVIENR